MRVTSIMMICSQTPSLIPPQAAWWCVLQHPPRRGLGLGVVGRRQTRREVEGKHPAGMGLEGE